MEFDDELSSLCSLQDSHVVFIQDDIFEESDDESQVPVALNDNPCINSFIPYRDEHMTPIDHNIFKQVVKEGFGFKVNLEEHKILYEYELYTENVKDPYDSNKLTKKFGVINEKEGIGALPGILIAIDSMQFKELSLFWISHKLMYGELGMSPKIPPKSDILARIQIAKVIDKFGNELKPQPDFFTQTIKEIKKLYVRGKNEFISKQFFKSIATYNKSVRMLENLRCANAKQEVEVNDYLSKIYLNLCICYNNVDKPQKTCIIMRDLDRLTPIKQNPKALHAKAKALMMLNDLKNAEKLFHNVLRMTPDNGRVRKALDEIKLICKNQAAYEAETKRCVNDFNHGYNNNQHWNGSDGSTYKTPNSCDDDIIAA